jgi:hypothetical protein
MADDDEVESVSGDTYTASRGSRLRHCIKKGEGRAQRDDSLKGGE